MGPRTGCPTASDGSRQGGPARARTRDSRRGPCRAGRVSLWIHNPPAPPGAWENHNLAGGAVGVVRPCPLCMPQGPLLCARQPRGDFSVQGPFPEAEGDHGAAVPWRGEAAPQPGPARCPRGRVLASVPILLLCGRRRAGGPPRLPFPPMPRVPQSQKRACGLSLGVTKSLAPTALSSVSQHPPPLGT